MKKTTLVIGASTSTERYSHKAVSLLDTLEYSVLAFGNKEGNINGITILTEFPLEEKIHTVSIYLRAAIQKAYYQQIIDLNPERIIFNPGTENSEFKTMAEEKGIDCENACTLVLLRTGQY